MISMVLHRTKNLSTPVRLLHLNNRSRQHTYICLFPDVSQFIRFRRFETATVHVLLQGFSISDCDWLRPPKASRSNENKPNQVEMAKRKELLADFLYWLFDGFIIELLRVRFPVSSSILACSEVSISQGNFNVTEGSGSKNQTLYFRQDDWRAICKPQWAALIKTNFESIPKVCLLHFTMFSPDRADDICYDQDFRNAHSTRKGTWILLCPSSSQRDGHATNNEFGHASEENPRPFLFTAENTSKTDVGFDSQEQDSGWAHRSTPSCKEFSMF